MQVGRPEGARVAEQVRRQLDRAAIAQRERKAAIEAAADAVEIGAERARRDLRRRRRPACRGVDETDAAARCRDGGRRATTMRRPEQQNGLRLDGALLGDDGADPAAGRLQPARGAALVNRNTALSRGRRPARIRPSTARRGRRSACAGRRPMCRYSPACARRPRPASAPSSAPASRARPRPIAPSWRARPCSWSGTDAGAAEAGIDAGVVLHVLPQP